MIQVDRIDKLADSLKAVDDIKDGVERILEKMDRVKG